MSRIEEVALFHVEQRTLSPILEGDAILLPWTSHEHLLFRLSEEFPDRLERVRTQLSRWIVQQPNASLGPSGIRNSLGCKLKQADGDLVLATGPDASRLVDNDL
ncbi:MAG: hypothetical protein U9Q81_01680 [Pseudomonadota bacterium]|nr:hypothetical protein [Pseudomonadota bacterium]